MNHPYMVDAYNTVGNNIQFPSAKGIKLSKFYLKILKLENMKKTE